MNRAAGAGLPAAAARPPPAGEGPLRGVHVLFVINDLRWFFSHRLPLATAAREQGARVSVAAPPGHLGGQVRALGFGYHPVAIHRGRGGVAAEAAAVGALHRLYRALRPDLVHHVTTKPVVYGSLAARAAGVPAVVNTVAGLGWVFTSDDGRARLLRRVLSLGYRAALAHPNSLSVFQNPDDLAAFVRAGLVRADRAELVRGAGVDTAVFAPSPEPAGEVATIALFSRMLWDKGVGEFAAAARLLREREAPVRCLLVGDPDPGNPSSIPEATLRGWTEEGILEWRGHSDDVPSLMRQASVVVLPSYREGLPKVLLEAAASARAVVTTDVPGCREVVREGVNGLLVPPRDASALAAAIERLALDPLLRRRMGAEGRRMVEADFSQERVIGRMLDLYVRLARGRAA